MMGFGWWFAVLALLAALFVAWPLVARFPGSGRGAEPKEDESDASDEFRDRAAFNDALYAEQLEDLGRQLENEEISRTQHDTLKKELEAQHRQDNTMDAAASYRRFGHASWLVAAVAILLPVVAFYFYSERGAADDWEIERLNTRVVRHQQRGADPETLAALNRELFGKLDARLAEKPDNLNNRFLLARTAVALGEYRRALEAYRYVLEREPNSPQVVGEMAQVLYMASGNRFTPEVRQVFDRALNLDPDNTELLGYAGIGAYQSGKYQMAIDYWRRGMGKLEAGDPRHQTWQRAIAQAESQLGDRVAESGQEKRESPVPEGTAESGSPSLQVTVALDEQVQAQPGDKVFIYARAWQGPKMPLAMQQVTVADLPLTLELNESMSMIEGMTMSRFPQLEVVARISSSGVANAQSGDWQATAGPVESDAADETVELLIDSQIP